MTNNSCVISRSTSQSSSVSRFFFHVADDGSFGEGGEGENVADGEGGLFTAKDERSGGETFNGDEGFGSHLVSVRVSEDDASEGSSTVKIVGCQSLSSVSILSCAVLELYPCLSGLLCHPSRSRS